MCRVGSIERSGGVLVLEVGCGGLNYQVESEGISQHAKENTKIAQTCN